MRKVLMAVAVVIGLFVLIDVVRNAGGVLSKPEATIAGGASIARQAHTPLIRPTPSQPVQPESGNGMPDDEITQLAVSAAKEAKAVTLTPISSGLQVESAGIRIDMPGTLVSNNAVRGRRLVVTESKTGTTYGFFITFGDNWGESPFMSLAYQFIEDVKRTFQDRVYDDPPIPNGRKMGRGKPMSGLLWEISGEKVECVLWIGRSQHGRYVGVYAMGLTGNAPSRLNAKEVERYFSSLQDLDKPDQ